MTQPGSRDSQITIGEQTFTVCFSLYAIVALRDHWKLESDDEVLARMDEIARNFQKGKLDFRVLADLLWAGLRENHPETTTEEAFRLLSLAGLQQIPEVMKAVFKTLLASAPPREARQARPPKHRAA